MICGIFVLALTDLNYSTGASRRIIHQLIAMKSQKFRPIVLTTKVDINRNEHFKFYEVGKYIVTYSDNYLYELKKELKVAKIALLKTLTLLVESQSKIVYIHSATRVLPQLITIILAKLLRKKLIYDYHDLLPETATFMRGLSHNSLLYKILLIYEKIVFSLSDYIFVVSDTMRDFLVQRYPHVKTKIFVIYNPVGDIKRNLRKSNKNMYNYIKKKFMLPKNSIVFVYAGKLEPKIRGLELLVDAFIKIGNKKTYKKPILLLVGSGPLKKWIQNKINIQNEKNIILTGELSHLDTISIIKEAHVAILPYPRTWDTDIALPAKLLEYMALEKLILSSNLKQAKKVLDRYAIFFKPNDINNLIQKILHITENFQKYSHYGKICRKIFLEKLSWDVTQQKYIKLLNEVCRK